MSCTGKPHASPKTYIVATDVLLPTCMLFQEGVSQKHAIVRGYLLLTEPQQCWCQRRGCLLEHFLFNCQMLQLHVTPVVRAWPCRSSQSSNSLNRVPAQALLWPRRSVASACLSSGDVDATPILDRESSAASALEQDLAAPEVSALFMGSTKELQSRHRPNRLDDDCLRPCNRARWLSKAQDWQQPWLRRPRR